MNKMYIKLIDVIFCKLLKHSMNVITLTLYTSILKVRAVNGAGVIGTVYQGSLWSSTAHII